MPPEYLTGLNEAIQFTTDTPPVNGSLAECVVDCLYGSKQQRIHNPTDAERATMAQLVDAHIATDKPIECLTMYGATKAYGQDATRNVADILDFAGIQRMGCLAERIKNHYPHGLRIHIVLENVTRMIRAKRDDMELRGIMEGYRSSIQQIIDTLALCDTIFLVNESELMEQNNVRLNDYTAMAKQNGDAFYRYWFDGELHGNWTPDMPAWKDVQGMGWNGFINGELWDYYCNRAKGEHPELNEYERAQSVSEYFGIVLARKQFGTLRMAGNGNPPIKVSLAPHPPAVDPAMHNGRIELKVKSTKNAHTLAPWVGYGYLAQRGNTYDFAFAALKEFRTIAPKLKPVTVTAQWEEALGTGKEGEGMILGYHQATFRADALSEP